jgi:hypothetical protein
MTELVLKKIGKHFGVEPWLEKEDDFLVLNNTGRIVGRIVMRACSPKGRPWVWTITARELCSGTQRAVQVRAIKGVAED